MIKLKTGTALGEKARLFYLTFWTTTFSPFTGVNVKSILIKGALLELVFVCLSDPLTMQVIPSL